jgi:hypothetical protein
VPSYDFENKTLERVDNLAAVWTPSIPPLARFLSLRPDGACLTPWTGLVWIVMTMMTVDEQ